MTSFGQYPLVYQLRQLEDGSFIPVGLAETSSLGSFSAVNIVVSSISAADYQGFEANVSFTGVLSIEVTGVGTQLIDVVTNPNIPVIRNLATPTNAFLEPSLAGDGAVQIGYGANPLSYDHGGTNSTDTPTPDNVAFWYNDGSETKLKTDGKFKYDTNSSNLSIGTGGQYQINGSQLAITNLANVNAPGSPNTFLQWNGSQYIWTGVCGTVGGSVSFPTPGGRIPVTDSTTNLNVYSDLTYTTGTKVLSTYAINNVCDVCAIRFNEGGTLLSDKFQGKDDTLTAIASLNPTTNQLIYFNGTNTAATATVSPCALELLNDSTYADMRTTLQLNSYYAPIGAYLTAIPDQYLTQTEGDGFYQACDVFLNTLASQNYVNLNSADVCNTLPIVKGGTNNAGPYGNDGIFYYDNSLQQFTNNSNVAILGTGANASIKSPNVCATTVCGTNLFQGGTNINAIYQPIGSYQPNNTRLHDLTAVTVDGLLRFNGSNYVTQPTATYETTAYARGNYETTGYARSTYETTGYARNTYETTGYSRSTYETTGYSRNTFALTASLASYETTAYSRPNFATTASLANYETTAYARSTYETTGYARSTFETTGYSRSTFETTGYARTNYETTGYARSTYETTGYSRNTFALTASLASYETTANANSTYLAKTTYNSFTGTLALSAGLKDVQITSPSNGQVLKWNGLKWINDTDATGTGGSTSPVGPEGAVQYRSGAGGFTGVDSFVFNQTSSLLATNSVSAGVIYAAGTGQIKTAKSNYVYYGAPAATTFNGITYPKGYVTQDQFGEFWFSSNATIAGATQPGPSSTLFVRRVCVGGAQTTTNNIGIVFGRFAANLGIGPGYDPIDLDPPEFLTFTGAANYLTYMDSSGSLSYTSSMTLYKKNGSLSATPDTLKINGTLISETLSATTDATIDGDLFVLNSAFITGGLEAGSVSATNISATNAYIASTVQFNTGVTPTLAVGQMSWNSTDQTLDIQTTVDTTLQIGQEQVMLVENKSGAAIQNGKVVYVSGSTGGSGKLNVGLAAASSTNSETAFIIGVATQTINDNSTGFVTTFGKVNGIPLPTSAFSDGDIAYLGDTPGELRNYKPGKPSHGSFQMGRVVRAHNTNGILFVTIRGSVDMTEIHDVASSIPSTGQVLVWNNASGLYEPKNVSAISGINNYATTGSLQDHIASAVHWDLTTLNNNYINASGDSVTGSFFFGTLSATTFSATTYRNLPTSALSGLSDTQITSPALSSVLKWNGTKWVAAPDQTGGGGGSPAGAQYDIQVNDGAAGFYADSSFQYDYDAAKVFISTNTLQVDSVATFNNSTDFTQPVTFTTIQGTSVSSTTVSATTYLNLPSGVATWNANKLQGVNISTATPSTEDTLVYNGTAWAPKSVIAISNVIGNNLISS